MCGSEAPDDYVYENVPSPHPPTTDRQGAERPDVFTECEWDTNENADGEFTPQACTAPQRTTLTEAVRSRFKWRTELTELYLCVSFC